MTIGLSDKYTKRADNGNIQTWIDLTIYNGKTYPLRVIKSNKDEDLLIAGDELFNDIHPAEWEDENEGFDPTNPKFAESVYNEIFFFTDNITLHYDDEMLRRDMAQENPEWFE